MSRPVSAPEAAGPPCLIAARALTHENFAPFGDLIVPIAEAGSAINAGTAQRYDDLTRLDVGDSGGEVCLAIFRSRPDAHLPPLRLHLFERHRLGSQTFVPMGQGRCLAVVAGAAERPDEAAIAAFIVEPGQGVTLRRGVWHHPLITLGAADILVIERRAAQADCDIVPVAGRFVVTVAP